MALLCCLSVATSALAAPVFTQVPGSPFATGPRSGPWSAAFSPSGGLLATANYSANTVSVFSVASNGALSQVPGSPFATGPAPGSVAFSPGGWLLATANSGGNTGAPTVSVFGVASDGALTQVWGSPFATDRAPMTVAFSPSGSLLATANSQTVSVFSVDPGGALHQVPGSPFTISPSLSSLAFSPSGGLLATADSGANTVSVFSVASNGALSQVPGSPFATGPGPVSVAFSPNGGLLATANHSATVSAFSVASNGALSQVPGSPLATGQQPRSVAFSPSGGLLATANFDANTVSVFSVASNGALSQVPGSPLGTGRGPASVAFSPNGGLLATANAYVNTVSVFSVGPPTAFISAPVSGGTYVQGESAASSFSCADAPYAPGVSSCVDSSGHNAPSGSLDTSSVGAHTYTVTATSRDGQSSTASITYEVVAVSSAVVSELSGDQDGDGVPDNLDRCPSVPRGAFDADGDGCVGPYAAIHALLGGFWDATARGLLIGGLYVEPVPPHATVAVLCRKHRCGYAQSVRSAKGGRVGLNGFKNRLLRRGERFFVRVTAPGLIGQLHTLTVKRYPPTKQGRRRANRNPFTARTACLPVGSLEPAVRCSPRPARGP